jgi:HK97 family phage prohead protease
MKREAYDFSGWASKNDLKCADGRTIRHNAFKVNDGKTVPLVWNHQHNSIDNVLGHAILENRDNGVYCYGVFNKTPGGQNAKECLHNGDISGISVWANNIDEDESKNVYHGVIREVSLVLAGANPGAFVESVVAHGEPMDAYDDEGIFYTGEDIIIEHAIDKKKKDEDEDEDKDEDEDEEVEDDEDDDSEDEEDDIDEESEDEEKKKMIKHSDDKTVGEVLDTLNDDQKKAVAIVIDQVLKDEKGAKDTDDDSDNEEEKEVKHNVFDTEEQQATNYISHADFQQIMADAKRLGSLRDAVNENFEEGGVLAHSIPMDGMTGPSSATASQAYGFRDPDMLFPEFRSVNGNTPEWLSREMDWVQKVLGGVHRTPFSRIKSVYADITEDAARAKGYIKGNLKKEEVFTLLKRTTDPQTIYKKQKMDRDDIIDITDFDVVAWIKAEMRVMLNEEIARAILIGDGRSADSDDKIQENHVRPIVTDVDLYNVKVPVTKAGAKEQINAIIRARKKYKGTGNPTFFTTEDVITEMLLLEDGIGHKLYKTEQELATALRVSSIVTVEPMEGYKVKINNANYDLIGVIVNLTDYNVGADKGGEINLFDDFDIDYNQFKYLMETRISGALIKPFSALTIYNNVGGSGSIQPQG